MRTFFACSVVLACLAGSSVAAAQTLATGPPKDTFNVTSHVTGLTRPTDFRFVPDGRIVIIEKGGAVRVRTVAGTLVNAGSFPVDTGSEKGLLGAEVHPSFATNKTLFFYYSRADSAGGTDLDRHRVVSIVLKDDNTLDMTTEKILVRNLRGPANHDGGALSILGDKIFIGVGDTGCNSSKPPGTGNATNFFGTCLTNGNGKVLRVNLDGSIPSDNPLASLTAVVACGASCGTVPVSTTTGAPRKDIWSWGYRNPFRVWADPTTGLLWVGDVGEVTWEEINVSKSGEHHGWPWREGAQGDPVTKCQDFTPDKSSCIDPVYACPRSDCQAITGGQIVDSCDWPTTFRGLYFFADSSGGQIWTLTPNATRTGIVAGSRANFSTGNSIVAIHTGNDGALYAVSHYGGALYRFAVKTPVVCPTPPDAGADTGPTLDSGSDAGPPTDSSTPGPDGSAADTATTADGALADTGVDPGASTGDSGGCGCRVQGTSDERWSVLALLAATASLRLRRRPC